MRIGGAEADQGSLVGVMIAGLAGLAWTEWGASGLPGTISLVVRIVGVVLGVSIVLRAVVLRRSAVPSERSMFTTRGYLLVVALEIVAFFGGGVLLNLTGQGAYVIAWYSVVLGCHFLAFGRLFFARFYWLGAVQIIAGVAGAVVGLAGGGRGGVEAVAGLLTAASLFASGGAVVLRKTAQPTIS
jgi:hypothetical protein